MVAAIRRRFDDDDLSDADGNGPYDKRFPGQRVIADGGRVRVPIALTDGMPPDWMRTLRSPPSDASAHRPRYADLTDARLQDGLRQAAEARSEWIKGLQDAWRTPTGGAGGAPVTTAPPSDQPDDDDDNLSPIGTS
jgi:hypothetical protein